MIKIRMKKKTKTKHKVINTFEKLNHHIRVVLKASYDLHSHFFSKLNHYNDNHHEESLEMRHFSIVSIVFDF